MFHFQIYINLRRYIHHWNYCTHWHTLVLILEEVALVEVLVDPARSKESSWQPVSLDHLHCLRGSTNHTHRLNPHTCSWNSLHSLDFNFQSLTLVKESKFNFLFQPLPRLPLRQHACTCPRELEQEVGAASLCLCQETCAAQCVCTHMCTGVQLIYVMETPFVLLTHAAVTQCMGSDSMSAENSTGDKNVSHTHTHGANFAQHSKTYFGTVCNKFTHVRTYLHMSWI